METNKTFELFKYWRKRVFISAWITYSTFYLCRVNMSIAIPGIMKEFGYTKTALGVIMTCLFFAWVMPTELKQKEFGSSGALYKGMIIILRFVTPVAILITILHGLEMLPFYNY